jgi:hypothetical protein
VANGQWPQPEAQHNGRLRHAGDVEIAGHWRAGD